MASSQAPLYEGPILDTHVHFWHPSQTPREVTPLVRLLGCCPSVVNFVAKYLAFPKDVVLFFASAQYLTNVYLPANYEDELTLSSSRGGDAVSHNVQGVVHVEAGWKGDPVDETRWLEKLDNNQDEMKIRAIVANADLTKSAAAVDELFQAHKSANSRVKGIRDMLGWHADKLVFNLVEQAERSLDPNFREGYAQLQKHGLVFETTCYHTQISEICELAETYPNQKICLEHIGAPIAIGGPYGNFGKTPEEREEIEQAWKESLKRLAESSNAYVKLSGWAMPLSGLGYEHRKEFPSVQEIVDKVGPFVRYILDLFGAERCMFGSNFPVEKVSLPLDTVIKAMKLMVQHLSMEDQERVFYGTACSFYGINE